jgi:hypothetical protein
MLFTQGKTALTPKWESAVFLGLRLSTKDQKLSVCDLSEQHCPQ